jgi:hypothetical protein
VWSGNERRTEGATDDEDGVQVQHEDQALFISASALGVALDLAVRVYATVK